MKFTIKHEKKGRIRVHLFQKYMNFTQADTLQYYLENLDGVKKAQVFNRTSDALIYYTGERNELLKAIQAFGYSRVSVPAQVLENSGRELNETYKEKLVNKVIFHYGRKLLLPYPLSAIYTTAMSVKYIWLGVKTLWKRKIEVPVLDATAIGVSIFRGDFSTAGSVMFLLGIGELLEEWTHKKSVDDLARTMSLNTGKVWLRSEGTEVLVDADKIQAGDLHRPSADNLLHQELKAFLHPLAGLQHFLVVQGLVEDSGCHVGKAGDAHGAHLHVARGDCLGNGGHAHRIGSKQACHTYLGRRLEVRAGKQLVHSLAKGNPEFFRALSCIGAKALVVSIGHVKEAFSQFIGVGST